MEGKSIVLDFIFDVVIYLYVIKLFFFFCVIVNRFRLVFFIFGIIDIKEFIKMLIEVDNLFSRYFFKILR